MSKGEKGWAPGGAVPSVRGGLVLVSGAQAEARLSTLEHLFEALVESGDAAVTIGIANSPAALVDRLGRLPVEDRVARIDATGHEGSPGTDYGKRWWVRGPSDVRGLVLACEAAVDELRAENARVHLVVDDLSRLYLGTTPVEVFRFVHGLALHCQLSGGTGLVGLDTSTTNGLERARLAHLCEAAVSTRRREGRLEYRGIGGPIDVRRWTPIGGGSVGESG